MLNNQYLSENLKKIYTELLTDTFCNYNGKQREHKVIKNRYNERKVNEGSQLNNKKMEIFSMLKQGKRSKEKEKGNDRISLAKAEFDKLLFNNRRECNVKPKISSFMSSTINKGTSQNNKYSIMDILNGTMKKIKYSNKKENNTTGRKLLYHRRWESLM